VTAFDGVLAVANASAGTADERNIGLAVAELRRGATVELARTSSLDELADVLDTLGDRRLVVVGGDGSLHAAIATLRAGPGSGSPLALIPLGTGNDLARTMQIPRDPVAAARLALTDQARQMDLLEDDRGGLVVNAVHVGVGAAAALAARSTKRLGLVGYAIGAVTAGARTNGWHVCVETDDGVLADGSRPLLMVAATVGRTIGGGTEIAPQAVVDDGRADVILSSSLGLVARTTFALALKRGRHLERDDVVGTRSQFLRVSGEAFPINVDGEVEQGVTQRAWRMKPHSWQLVAPPRPRR
jgi:diacylglycerol kinase family enzyme